MDFIKKNFKIIVLLVVLLVPFIYSFFYLKAYWNPYGEGNIDNIPVAIVNNDDGSNGKKIITSIKNSKKLKLSVVSEEKAESGLNDGSYYAVIKIPDDFSSSMESISTTNKHHPTITYSPNQKSNYLASQIINSVVNAVEKNLDNQVNSKIVSSLTDTIETVPDNLNTISDGFTELKSGTSKLTTGSSKLNSGVGELALNYQKFHEGVNTVKNGNVTLASSIEKLNNGIETLDNATSNFSALGSKLNELQTGVATIKSGSDNFTSGLTRYTNLVNLVTSKLSACYSNDPTGSSCTGIVVLLNQKLNTIVSMYESYGTASGIDITTYYACKNMASVYGEKTLIEIINSSSTELTSGNASLNSGINSLNEGVSNLNGVDEKITSLQSGIKILKEGSNELLVGANKLSDGATTLANSSMLIYNGINSVNSGTNELNNGLQLLDSSVATAKDTLDSKISNTKNDIKKVETLSDYSKEPVKIKTKEVNKVSSYGTAFSPLFISIGLWVGCLMMFMVLYYDKKERFGIFSENNPNKVKRNLMYHLIITISSFILGLLLMIFLDFEITNVFVYFISIILIGNAFMAIMAFLIENFNDIGKFIALIILILQLAASGGTFPIETVTKGFRFMNNFLPMTYAVRLLKESLIKFENNLFTTNFLVLLVIFIVLFIINLCMNFYKEKKTY